MSDTRKRIDELAASSERAKKAGPLRESLSLPEDRSWDSPFSGVRLKDVFSSRKAASDKLQNLRDEETEDLLKREKRESRGMKKGGMTASKRADGVAIRGKTRA
jgi:hypothetical protein